MNLQATALFGPDRCLGTLGFPEFLPALRSQGSLCEEIKAGRASDARPASVLWSLNHSSVSATELSAGLQILLREAGCESERAPEMQ